MDRKEFEEDNIEPRRQDNVYLLPGRGSIASKRPHQRTSAGRVWLAVGLATASLGALLAWSFRHQSAIQRFTAPVAYVVVPGQGLAHVNERKGAGTEFATVRKYERGASVSGVGTTKAKDGSDWIALADGEGFIKASLLSPAPSPEPPQQPSPPPANTATPAESAQAPSPAQSNIPAPVEAAQPDEPTRLSQIITSSNFYEDQSADSGAVPGRSMVLRVDVSYSNARPGDVAGGGIVSNGQIIGRCNPIPLQVSGTFWCRIPIFSPGHYIFMVGIDGAQLVSHEFAVNSSAQSQPMLDQPPQNSVNPQRISPLQQMIAQEAARKLFNAMRHSH